MLTIEVEGGFLETMKYVGEWVSQMNYGFPYFNLSSGLSGYQRNGDAVLVFRVSYRQRCESLMSCSFYVLVTTVS